MDNTNTSIATKLDRLTSALSRASTEELEASLSTRAGGFTSSETLCIQTAHKAIHAQGDAAADTVMQEWENASVRLADLMPGMSRREMELFNLADSAVERACSHEFQ
ncbi:MAG: hypothetical protein KKE51_03615 [Gammaproteobacteria bacterium]|nr:hypothetical protein [Gammaproteobacteria bacterium]MBU1602193.1 hypothetical protein [Gammaproteobacteria bacterium]MBU2434240.1 hypothetical protein [Gammaproteobacteria bacterium]MBU2448435.1 hypothetical protein [Gammaproteobacteria bacterium]